MVGVFAVLWRMASQSSTRKGSRRKRERMLRAYGLKLCSNMKEQLDNVLPKSPRKMKKSKTKRKSSKIDRVDAAHYQVQQVVW